MEFLWVLGSAVTILVIIGIIASNLRDRRLRKAMNAMLPEVKGHFEAGRSYNVRLSHGQWLNQVRFIGISAAHGGGFSILPFPLCQWLVLEREGGQRLYVKPESVRYYEDCV